MRIDFGVDQRHQRLDHFQTDAGEAARQAIDFQHHNQAHQIVVGGRTDAGGMRQHDRALQVFQIFTGDAGGCQQAETGVTAVGGTVFLNDTFNAGNAFLDICVGVVVQSQGDRVLINFTQLRQCQLAWANSQRFHALSP
ncbi:hypothetical protein D3C73_1332970 [compost metagenome]